MDPGKAPIAGAWRVALSSDDKAGMLKQSQSNSNPTESQSKSNAAEQTTAAQRASEIVLSMSEGSLFFANQQKKALQTEEKAEELKRQYESLQHEIAANQARSDLDRPVWMRSLDRWVAGFVDGQAAVGEQQKQQHQQHQQLQQLQHQQQQQQQQQQLQQLQQQQQRHLQQQQQHLQQQQQHLQQLQQRQQSLVNLDESHLHGERFTADVSRVYVHVDMDCFYAAVAIRDNPSLKGKPIGVGGSAMLSTASYEARKFGVRSAMPGFIARRLCPELIIVPSDFGAYRLASAQMMEVLRRYDADARKMSLDEASLDVTLYLTRQRLQQAGFNTDTDAASAAAAHGESLLASISESEELCKRIMTEVEEITHGLTCSIGCAPNRRLAKIAADENKPNGFLIVEPSRAAVRTFMSMLPVRKVSGIGKVTAHLLGAIGIERCGQLFDMRYALSRLFSPDAAQWFVAVSLGLGNSRDPEGASAYYPDTARKSVSCERTFRATSDARALENKLRELCSSLCESMCDLAPRGLKGGRCATLKLKLSNFDTKSRAATLVSALPRIVQHASDAGTGADNGAKSLPAFSAEPAELFAIMLPLLRSEYPLTLPVRLMGVRLSNLQWSAAEKAKSDRQSILNFFGRSSSRREGDSHRAGGGKVASSSSTMESVAASSSVIDVVDGDVEHLDMLGGDDDDFAIPLTASASPRHSSPTSSPPTPVGDSLRSSRMGTPVSDLTSFLHHQSPASRFQLEDTVSHEAHRHTTADRGPPSPACALRNQSLSQWVRAVPDQEQSLNDVSCPICGLKLDSATGSLWRNDHVEQCLHKEEVQRARRRKRLLSADVVDVDSSPTNMAMDPGPNLAPLEDGSTLGRRRSKMERNKRTRSSAPTSGAQASLDAFVRVRPPKDATPVVIELL